MFHSFFLLYLYLQKKVKSLESNLSLIKDQRDQYLSSIIQLTKKVEHLKNEDNDLEKNIKKVAKLCIGNNDVFNNIIEKTEFNYMMPIELQKKLESCEKCHGSMMLCYYEPRLNFPIHQLLRSSFHGTGDLELPRCQKSPRYIHSR